MKSFKYLSFTAILMLALCFEAAAQVGLQLALNQRDFLLYEGIYAKVRIRNYSGRALIFGEEDLLKGKLEFEILDNSGEMIPKSEDYDPLVGTVLSSGSTKEVLLPLSRMYPIRKPGSYTVKAVLSHKSLASDYQSRESGFSVVNGTSVWKKTVGVPDMFSSDSGEKQLPRDVSIKYYNNAKDRIYSLVIEDKKFVYRVVRLGLEVGIQRPECRIDHLSRIHILLQISPKVFTYHIFDINGILDQKDVYVKTDVSPMLVFDEDTGRVMIVGGKKGVENIDYVEDEYIKFIEK